MRKIILFAFFNMIINLFLIEIFSIFKMDKQNAFPILRT